MRIPSIALWLSLAVSAAVATAADTPPTTATQQQASKAIPASTAVAASEPARPKPQQSADEEPPFDGRHPGDTALSKNNGKWQIKSFPTLMTLYVSDRDRPGKSNCNSGCDSAWPPLFVSKHEATDKVGDWKVIVRNDGRTQWAYKGQPVYVRFHDVPLGAHEISEGWRKLEP